MEITDTDRLNWLINNSALDDREDEAIQLIVTERAVLKCWNTRHKDYHDDVRAVIDEEIRNESFEI